MSMETTELMRTTMSSPPTETEGQCRGDITRQKLLSAAVEIFGCHGYEGTSTRALAEAAGANLHAIKYYFGDKKGLYLAAADHIVALINAHIAEIFTRVAARLAEAEKTARPIRKSEARALLTDIIQTLAVLHVSSESESWSRFMMREQMEPTEAFDRMYADLMKPDMETIAQLLSSILHEPPESEHIRLLTLSLIGSVLMFRMANATAMTHLGWERVGPREIESIRKLSADLVATITVPTRTKAKRCLSPKTRR